MESGFPSLDNLFPKFYPVQTLGMQENMQPSPLSPRSYKQLRKKVILEYISHPYDSICDNKQNNIYGGKRIERCLQIKSSV